MGSQAARRANQHRNTGRGHTPSVAFGDTRLKPGSIQGGYTPAIRDVCLPQEDRTGDHISATNTHRPVLAEFWIASTSVWMRKPARKLNGSEHLPAMASR